MLEDKKNELRSVFDTLSMNEVNELSNYVAQYVQQRKEVYQREEGRRKEIKDIARQYFKLKYPFDIDTEYFWGSGRDGDDYDDFKEDVVAHIPFKEIRNREQLFVWIDNYIHDHMDDPLEEWENYYNLSDKW